MDQDPLDPGRDEIGVALYGTLALHAALGVSIGAMLGVAALSAALP